MRISTFLLSLIFCFSSLNISAQVNLESDTLYTSVQVGDGDVVAHNFVTNVLPQIKTFKWIRTNISIPDEWESFVCDINTCWTSAVDSMEFDLGPSATSLLDVHVDINDQPVGSALIEVLIKDVNDEDNLVNGVFYFNGVSSLKDEDNRIDFKVYPNPSNGIFSIDQEGFKLESIEIYSTSGRLLTSARVNNTANFNILDLNPGTYILQLVSVDGERSIPKLITKL